MTTKLNTLFVTTDGAWVGKEHETVVVRIERETRLQVPMLHLAGVICMGRVSVSPELMFELTERGTAVSHLDSNGRFLARVEGIPGGSVLLRRAQFRAADDAGRTLEIARSCVAGKIANTRSHLLRAAREARGERSDSLGRAGEELLRRLSELERANRLETVRGVEGMAARQYWGVFNLLVKQQCEDFSFGGRTRRPPMDRINALLSFGYALLLHDCVAACASAGLDPAVGFLHEDRPGRLSLALDLMEELRVPAVDRLVLALINRRQVSAGDVVADPLGGWRLSDAGRKAFIVAWHDAKREQVRHPFLESDTTWQRVPFLQALLLARHLRGEMDVYPPFLLK